MAIEKWQNLFHIDLNADSSYQDNIEYLEAEQYEGKDQIGKTD